MIKQSGARAKSSHTDPLGKLTRVRRNRASLRATTALQAVTLVVLAGPAMAQLASNTRPAGGQVAAGSASIATNGATTQITQSSENAVINWQSYNVGSGQTVQYAQPNAQAFTLNRVVSANPSQIAGHIIANGRIAIVNQSGVIFLDGSTVDTSGLVVSAANITNADFMAGRLVFSQAPNAGAVISNAGNITIKNAGLAALVAPQVQNSGTISAALGTVILAGASTHTIDMYGDGLISINVTGAVTPVEIGGKTIPALVTNIGTILAPGGNVVLTASAADGLVQTLVNAGGVIAAPTVAGQVGHVLVNGIGGDVEIDGAISASGTAAGIGGGTVTINSDHAVTVQAGATIDASGGTGGGAISIGANAVSTNIAAGANISANATARGNGGQITIIASQSLTMQGNLSARGGPGGGNGGAIAINGAGLLLAGNLDASAPAGRGGSSSVLTSGDVLIENNCGGLADCITYADFVSSGGYASSLDVNNGYIRFDGTANISSAQTINLVTTLDGNNTGFSGDIYFGPGVTLTAPGFNVNSAGAITLGGTFITSGSFNLTAASYISEVAFPGGSPTETGSLDGASVIIGGAGQVKLGGTNTITTLGSVSTSGFFTLTDTTGLSVTAPLTAAGDVSITVAGGLNVTAPISGADVSLSAGNGLTIGSGAAILATATNGTLALTTTAGDLSFGGTLAAPNVSLTAQAGSVLETGTGAVQAGTLTASATAPGNGPPPRTPGEIDPGDITLASSGNTVSTIAGLTASGSVSLTDTGSATLTTGGTMSGAGITLSLTGNTLTQLANSVIASTGTVSVAAELLAQDSGAQLTAVTGFSTTGAVSQTGGLISVSDGAAATGIGLAQSAASTFVATSVIIGAQDAGTLTQAGGSTIEATGAGGVTVNMTGNVSQDSTSVITADSGTILLNTIGASLFLAGTLSAANAASGGIILEAGAGSIFEAASAGGSATGTLIAPSLGGGASGTVSLNTASGAGVGNQLAKLTGFYADGGFTLVDGTALSITGALTGANIDIVTPSLVTSAGLSATAIGGTIALAADSFALGAAVDASAVDLGLLHEGAFTVAATDATISGASLANISAGTLVLGSANGTATGTATGSTWTSASSGEVTTLTIGQAISLPSGTLGLFSAGDVDAPSAITAGAVFASAGGNISITDAANQIGALSGIGLVAGGTITLADGQNLTLDAHSDITGPGGITLSLANFTLTQLAGSTITTTGGGVAITGALAQNGATVTAHGDIGITGGLTQTTATVLSSTGDITLGGALTQTDGHLIATAGGIDATLTGGVSQDSASAITAATNITLTTGGGELYLAGDVTAPGQLVLTATNGTITQTAAGGGGSEAASPSGAVVTATLTASAGGDLLLNSADGNAIGTVTGATAGGAVSVTDSVSLAEIATGTIAGASITLTDTHGGLYLGGIVNAPGLVSLISTGGAILDAVSATAPSTGTLSAGTLLATAAGGNLSFTGGANAIGTIANATATGSLALTDSESLVLATSGTIAAPGGVTLSLAGHDLTQLANSAIRSASGTVAIDAALLSQTSGASLSGSTGVGLTGAVSQSGGTLTAVGAAVTIGGSVAQSDDSVITGATVSVGAGGEAASFSQAASTLRATGAGGISITVAGNITQDSASTLASPTGPIALSSTGGNIEVGGTVSAPQGLVSLLAPDGFILQAGQDDGTYSGTLVAATLTAQAGGTDSLGYGIALNAGSANQIATITTVTATGGVAIADGANLTLATDGMISGSDTVTLNLGSATLTLADGATITSALRGLSITAGAVTQSANSLIKADDGAIDIDANLMQTNATLTAGTAIAIDGTTTQNVSSTILSLGGDITLSGAVNQSGASISTPGNIFLGGALTQTGGLVTQGEESPITVAAEIQAGGNITQTGPGAISQDSGFITASGNTVLQGDITQLFESGIAGQNVTLGGSLSQQSAEFPSDVLATNGNIQIAGAVSQNGGVISATNGGVTIGGATTQTGGNINATGTIVLAGPVIQIDSVISAGGDIDITATGTPAAVNLALKQSGSTLTAAGNITIDGTTTQTADSYITAPTGNITFTGNVNQTSSEITADYDINFGAPGPNAGVSVSQVDGFISGNGNVLITNGLSQSGSDLVAGNNLIADGLISQTANSSIFAGNVITFNADIVQNASSIGAQNITLSGNLTQQNGSTVDATTGFTAINLSNITQSGGSTLAGGTGGITIGGTLTQNDSTLSATGAINLATSNPAAVPSVEVTQTNGGTIISTGGNIYVLGGFNQTDSSLTAAGNISLVATALTQNNSVIATSGGSLTLSGAGTGGAVSQSNGSTLYGANGISLALQGSLSQDASSEIYASNGNIAITAGGGISFTGLIQAGTQTTSGAYSGTLLLDAAGGSVDAASGTLLAGGLTIAASGDIDIASPADTYGAIIQSGGFAGITAGGNVNFAQTAALALSDATISAGGAVTITDASGITVSNSRITAGGAINITDASGITLASSQIAAGGNVSLAANTGNLTEDSASTIASQAGTISLNAPGTVTLAGTISAPKITVGEFGTGNATGPASVVLNGGTIDTGTAVAEGSFAQNVAQAQNSDSAAGGLFITAGSVTQTGSTVINGLGGDASVQLALTGPGGNITLDGTQGLQAPGAQLLIDLQSTGTATGNINVRGLNIFYGAGGPAAGTYARLTGLVDNDSGFAAAGAGFVHPQQYAADQINGCTIGSVNCVLLTPVTTEVPLFLPVFEIDITPARKRDDDDDLILPNVGEQDY